MSLRDKVILVTGGTSGIGEGCARHFASLGARVVLASRDGTVVPTGSVVRRPAGEVVYVLSGEQVAERRVAVGIRTAESAEILDGVKPGETVVVSGAGFLTDGALVTVREPAAAGAPR